MYGLLYEMVNYNNIQFINCTNNVVHNHTEDYYDSYACGFTWTSSFLFYLINCTSSFTINEYSDYYQGTTTAYAVGRYLYSSCIEEGFVTNYTTGKC